VGLRSFVRRPLRKGLDGDAKARTSKLPHVLRRIGVQFERYPLIEALVLQDMSAEGTRRSRRIRELNDAIAEYAETYGIPVITYSREQVQGCFQQFGLRH